MSEFAETNRLLGELCATNRIIIIELQENTRLQHEILKDLAPVIAITQAIRELPHNVEIGSRKIRKFDHIVRPFLAPIGIIVGIWQGESIKQILSKLFDWSAK